MTSRFGIGIGTEWLGFESSVGESVVVDVNVNVNANVNEEMMMSGSLLHRLSLYLVLPRGRGWGWGWGWGCVLLRLLLPFWLCTIAKMTFSHYQ